MADVSVTRSGHSGNIVYRLMDGILRTVLHHLPISPLTERISLWWGYRYRPAPAVANLRSGARISITLNDHLQLLLYYFGTFEPRSLQLMKEFLRPGATVIDVGANIGFYTIEAAAAVRANGLVIAIEASPSLAKIIDFQLKDNHVSNVTLIPNAVGESEGVARLTLPTAGNHGMFTLGNVEGTFSADVPVRTIDDIVKQTGVKSVDFIKMDIEGSEFSALKGAIETIKNFHPPILIELNEVALRGCGASSRQVKALLQSLGYSGSVVGQSNQISLDQTHVCDECIFTYRLKEIQIRWGLSHVRLAEREPGPEI